MFTGCWLCVSCAIGIGCGHQIWESPITLEVCDVGRVLLVGECCELLVLHAQIYDSTLLWSRSKDAASQGEQAICGSSEGILALNGRLDLWTPLAHDHIGIGIGLGIGIGTATTRR